MSMWDRSKSNPQYLLHLPIKHHSRLTSRTRLQGVLCCCLVCWVLFWLLGMMVQHQNQALVEIHATLETMGNCF